ncbi:ABC-F family ATP-binding cassette domain-containing protein [Paenibacillus sp. ACRRX]|uniref:ABC-F family ATP-binding cassette domain-containing protein n=1 Tax=unclassified Paenibacillus TaxID=185978 RepID=UPI001EF52D83|nr:MULTISPECIES: ABC-F family ATP-binding cassette domain-containing protein [unclassified Paenibacillus]MCG7408948.1 ABC-F family ATP-binding cassette domain-containing protein [Paenibacillus sp. ACRRX]MDK8182058.1 ABC-F family ATP-binding cassette domain-containing protein [Paenibacillus sp. UMB4589-SE434]
MLLQVNGINKNYGITPVLTNITFHMNDKERIGLVGVNGAGKSTLLQIIAGELTADAGTIYRAKETKMGYLAQNSGLQSDRSIWDEMMLVFSHLTDAEQELRDLEQQIADPALAEDTVRYEDALHRYSVRSDWFREQGGYAMEAKVRGILHGMGFGGTDPDTAIHTLSGGQKTRLALAKMLLQQPDLLLLDEPTNHLDIDTLTWLEQYLRSYPGAVLVVSHDRYFLDAMVTSIVEIERHQAKRYSGNYTKYMELKAAEYEQVMKLYEKQQDEIAKLEDFVRRNLVRASTTKRAQSRRKTLEKMERIERPIGELKRARFSFEVARSSGKDVLRVRDASFSYENSPPLFQQANLDLNRGEMVALIGPNGVGKSTLLKALIEKHSLTSGTINWGTHVMIGYYDQEQTTLNPNHTVLEELWNEYPHMEEVRIRTVLGSFLFSGDDVQKKVSTLSGGEKARVALAKLMLQDANMLILDEPTNHLDLFSKEVLESALMEYEGTLLFISHDRYFLNKMAERIVELAPDGMTSYLGNYDDYTAKKQELEEDLEMSTVQSVSAAAATSKTTSVNTGSNQAADARGASQFEQEKQAKREERARQRRLEQIEVQIAEWEAFIEEQEALLTDPEVYNDYVRVQAIQQQIDEQKAKLEAAYAEWEANME